MTWGGSGPFLFDGAAIELGFIPIEGATPPPGGFLGAWIVSTNSVIGDKMKKNVAGQKIGAQMITASDGTAFTGTVTVYVTGDGGTQGAGGGSVTHEGNGYHGYAPTQAETNYDHIAFTFTGTGAVSATAQVFTDFPQTGDSFARIGAPAGASVSADVAAVKAETAAILTDTGTTLPATLATIAGYIDTEIGTLQTSVNDLPTNGELTTALSGLATAANLATVDTVVDAIKAKTDSLTFTVAGQVDANAESMNGAEILGNGTSGDLWRGE